MSKGIVLLAAGGTGGHVFPAEALAYKLKERGYSVHLVTDSRAERYAGKFPADEIHVVPSATIGSKNPLKVAQALWTLWTGMRAARKLIQRIKPVCVVGFGGYPTVPPLLAATRMGVPSMLHEQNAVMGRANKMLATRVRAIAGGFLAENGAFAEKTVTTGNPVRPAVIEAAKRPYVPSGPEDPFNLVVFGGSQGAQYFSKAVPTAISLLEEPLRKRLRITQQVRPEDMETVNSCTRKLDMGADVAPFFNDMAERIGAAHSSLPLRCLHGLRACGYRAPRDPGSLSACARSRSGGQCGCTGGNRRREGHRAVGTDAGETFHHSARRHDHAGKARKDGCISQAGGQTGCGKLACRHG